MQRQGRTVSTTEAFLIDEEGKPIVSAYGMHLTPTPHQILATQVQHIGDPDAALAAYEEAARLNPENLTAQVGLMLRALRGGILAERTPELANEPGSWRP